MERDVKSMENVFGMKSGEGDASYSRLSSVQLKMIQELKPLLESGISQHLNVDNLSATMKGAACVFRIADLGCASGINTLLVADTIVRAVRTACTRRSILEMPDFQVFFVDLPSNDFNLLLRSLPPHDEAGQAFKEDGGNRCFACRPPVRSYFAAAVSGSFYKRLFPPKSLHFCHSSTSLHWLSQVPDRLSDRNSPAWNNGRVYISRDEVGAAYLSQITKDFSAFLRARAEEMVPGGCMFLSLLGRSSVDIKEAGGIGDFCNDMEDVFQELVMEGVIEEDKVDSFNLAIYGPNVEEMESIVEMENSFEMVERVKLLRGFPMYPLAEVREGEEEMFGRMLAKFHRVLTENVLRSHLGSDELTNEYFSRLEKIATARSQEFAGRRVDVVVAFLVRK